MPKGVNGITTTPLHGTTMAGSFSSSQLVILNDVSFPAFYRTRTINDIEARVLHSDCRYDIIIGRDVLRQIGLKIDFESNLMIWDESSVEMQTFPTDRNHYITSNLSLLDGGEDDDLELHHEQVLRSREHETEVFDYHNEGYKSKTITQSTYKETDIDHVIASCVHLSPSEQQQLLVLLNKFPTLFNGKLKYYTDHEIHLDLDPSVQPTTTRPYAVPHMQMGVFKKELDRLCTEDVLERTGGSEWIAGTFIIPKKDGSVRWISDFRGLNRALRRKVYHLPRIQDVLRRRRGYTYVTKIDLTMCYYTYRLDEESSQRCTIATPFGLYRYKRLPMGVSVGPDIAQQRMEDILRDIDDIEIYIDDIAVFSNGSYEDHVAKLERVLTRLQTKGFTIQPAKCEWCVQETDFLGHWLTPTGYKPLSKKVDAIIAMKPPQNITQLRSFIGLVNYYRDMWPRRAHVLAPLTALSGKKKLEWTDDCQKAFEAMKALVTADALLHYPDHNKPFEIDTDASDYQLGAVIKQNGRPVAYYTRKLNSAQRNYTTIEKELLSVVETFREFRDLLLGARITVYTDHQNLTHHFTQHHTQRVMRWRLLLEEFSPRFVYKKGETNVVADALSRLPRHDEETPSLVKERPFAQPASVSHNRTSKSAVSIGTPVDPQIDCSSRRAQLPDDIIDHGLHDSSQSCIFTDSALAECLMMYPRFDTQGRYPFHMETIASYQREDPSLKDEMSKHPDLYKTDKLHKVEIIMTRPNKQTTDWKIYIGKQMIVKLIEYYHLATAHALGETRLYQTISRHFYHPLLVYAIKVYLSRCKTCQRMKKGARPYGLLSPRDATIAPWEEVHVDSLGPWTYKHKGITIRFSALSMIDPVTNLMELALYRTPTQTSAEATHLFETSWLSRYPRPVRVLSDNGTEFVGHEFQTMCQNAGIDPRRNTAKNAQSNAIIESVHTTIGQVARTMLELEPPTRSTNIQTLLERILSIAMHATRCAAHSSLANHSPGSIAFRRDMFLNIPLIADIITLSELRQLQIDKRLLKANAKRIPHDYKINDQVFVKRNFLIGNKLKPQAQGPFRVIQVHTNGTVTIQRKQTVRERINIRRLKPYRPLPSTL